MSSERRPSPSWIHERRRARLDGPFSRPSLSRCRFRLPHREGARWVLPTNLVGEASSYLRSGLSALPCSSHAWGVASGISLIYGQAVVVRSYVPAISKTGRLIWHGAACSLAVARGRGRPGGPLCDDANDVRDREKALEPSVVDRPEDGGACPRTDRVAHTHAGASGSPGPVGAAVGLSQRADVARSLVERFVRAWRHGEHPAQLVDGCESLTCHPVL
jgi:hypothetical protein